MASMNNTLTTISAEVIFLENMWPESHLCVYKVSSLTLGSGIEELDRMLATSTEVSLTSFC